MGKYNEIWGKLMAYLERIAQWLSRWFNWVAASGLVAMMVLTSADVILRSFRRPIPGTFEIVGFLCVVVIAFAIGHTQILRGHISVEIVVLRLPQRAQGIIGSIMCLLGLGLFVLLAWQSLELARDLWLSGQVSPTEKIPFFPFVYGIALACVPICLVLLVEFLKSLAKAVRK
jgi:TRAP-type C4-dicarboxylate transport system permease small subunit